MDWEKAEAAQIAGADFAGLAAGREDAMRAKKFREPAPPMTSLRKLRMHRRTNDARRRE
jgi:hypothetical protein